MRQPGTMATLLVGGENGGSFFGVGAANGSFLRRRLALAWTWPNAPK